MHKNNMTYRVAGWLSLGISVALYLFFIFSLYLKDVLIPPNEAGAPPTWTIVKMSLFGLGTVFLMLFILFAINFRVLNSNLTRKKQITMIILASVLFTVIYSIGILYIQIVLNPSLPEAPHPPARWAGVIRDLFLAGLVMIISQLLYLTQKKQQAELNYEAMKAENANSRFEALKNQLDPHFLFNTLNTLDSLMQEDAESARNYLQQLSSVFRYVMPNKELTTLEDELKFTRSYNGLMQLRYDDSLVFKFDIDDRLLNYMIVPLSIQTLVENAIKHNVISSDQPFVVSIKVGPEPVVVVSNEIRPKKTEQSGSGIGLSNLAERFRLKLGKEIAISNTDGVFTVTLPLHLPENNL